MTIYDVDDRSKKINSFLGKISKMSLDNEIESVVVALKKRDGEVLTGIFRGETSVFELIGMNEAVKDMIKEGR